MMSLLLKAWAGIKAVFKMIFCRDKKPVRFHEQAPSKTPTASEEPTKDFKVYNFDTSLAYDKTISAFVKDHTWDRGIGDKHIRIDITQENIWDIINAVSPTKAEELSGMVYDELIVYIPICFIPQEFLVIETKELVTLENIENGTAHHSLWDLHCKRRLKRLLDGDRYNLSGAFNENKEDKRGSIKRYDLPEDHPYYGCTQRQIWAEISSPGYLDLDTVDVKKYHEYGILCGIENDDVDFAIEIVKYGKRTRSGFGFEDIDNPNLSTGIRKTLASRYAKALPLYKLERELIEKRKIAVKPPLPKRLNRRGLFNWRKCYNE